MAFLRVAARVWRSMSVAADAPAKESQQAPQGIPGCAAETAAGMREAPRGKFSCSG